MSYRVPPRLLAAEYTGTNPKLVLKQLEKKFESDNKVDGRPMLEPQDVTRGIGLLVDQESKWASIIDGASKKAQSELQFRLDLNRILMSAEGLDREQRRILRNRAIDYRKSSMKKSRRVILTPEQAQGMLRKAEPQPPEPEEKPKFCIGRK